ncbi:uncharacterized protein LOC127874492 [Dreissena polymorpha]|uniref:Uncharacterized protein n=1 Tax=Dreissena polymorpha TaxID=45954 RepID=A0A9D4L399_DREPO|nr:uncharacterized protein LOC127874492 [Dreissena polymorpha]KAH3850474.1 hypothetical protein DPMN_092885 [Dreissena polymorpha]
MSKSYLHVHLPRVPMFRRPLSARTGDSRAAPKLKDTHNLNHYIMITDDMLDAFKQRVAKSSKVTLKLNNVKYKERKKTMSKSQFPFVTGDRRRGMHGKCYSSLDLKDAIAHRPVRVFVDDITQCFSRSVTLNDVDDNVNVLGGDVYSGSHRWRSKHVELASQVHRSMDAEDEGNFRDTVVETVARANTTVTEHAQVLPEIRAAPCPIHTKRHEIYGAFSTDIRSPRRHTHLQFAHQANNISSPQTKEERKSTNVRIPHQIPPTKPPPMLPRNMSSKDYVMTWLVHGSDPSESNHFPEIIPNTMKSPNKKQKSKSESRFKRASIVD